MENHPHGRKYHTVIPVRSQGAVIADGVEDENIPRDCKLQTDAPVWASWQYLFRSATTYDARAKLSFDEMVMRSTVYYRRVRSCCKDNKREIEQ